MNETTVYAILRCIYDACNMIENIDMFSLDEDIAEYMLDLYNDLFDKTTEIEIYFGIIEG